jgi:hypothetical protein
VGYLIRLIGEVARSAMSLSLRTPKQPCPSPPRPSACLEESSSAGCMTSIRHADLLFVCFVCLFVCFICFICFQCGCLKKNAYVSPGYSSIPFSGLNFGLMDIIVLDESPPPLQWPN